MPAWETTQLLLGLLVVPLIALHASGTRGTRELLGIEINYLFVLGAIWTDTGNVVRQYTLVVVVWLHVVVGLHIWLRVKPRYPKRVPLLSALALLLPTLSLLGFTQTRLSVRSLIGDTGAGDFIFSDWANADPAMRSFVIGLDRQIFGGFLVILVVVALLRLRSQVRGSIF